MPAVSESTAARGFRHYPSKANESAKTDTKGVWDG